MAKFPIESKVHAAGVGAGAGSLVAPVLLYLLGILVYGGSKDAAAADATVKLVPSLIAEPVTVLVPLGLAYLGGFLAHHSARPPDPPANGGGYTVSLAAGVPVVAGKVYTAAGSEKDGD